VLWLGDAARAPAGGAARLRPFPPRSALEEPERARARVAQLFLEAFELPEEPWERGAGVPFERELAEGLAALDPGAEPARLRRELGLLLGPAPTGADCD
jgi:hypothetical protein